MDGLQIDLLQSTPVPHLDHECAWETRGRRYAQAPGHVQPRAMLQPQ